MKTFITLPYSVAYNRRNGIKYVEARKIKQMDEPLHIQKLVPNWWDLGRCPITGFITNQRLRTNFRTKEKRLERKKLKERQ